jgi:hypothetical protein
MLGDCERLSPDRDHTGKREAAFALVSTAVEVWVWHAFRDRCRRVDWLLLLAPLII